MDELDLALRQHFGFEQFRPGQREVIERILVRRHTLAVLPTGLGKSLCYQLASRILPGITVVVSPLVALMQDQVESLARRGFHGVTFLSHTLPPAEVAARCSQIEGGHCKLVYVSPERFDSPRFQQLVRKAAIDLLVIDEAHCISQWGRDFRPQYRTLFTRLPELWRATFLALTATATPDVQDDIAAALGLPEIERVSADFSRPGLRFEVVRMDAARQKDERLLRLLATDNSPAIVYASTHKQAEQAFELIADHGVSACLYHPGLDARTREQAHRRFQRGDVRVIVATVAFGLGIDKPDIRQVIHYNIPGALENYYQEAGRAGRDGSPALCTLLYWPQDVRIQRLLLDSSYPDPPVIFSLYKMLLEAHPLPVPAGDLARASELYETTVNAALQLLCEQGQVTMTPGGKYQVADFRCEHPDVNFHPFFERRRRANERLRKMVEYAGGENCRRAGILNYLGQPFAAPCGNCDVCGPAGENRLLRAPEDVPGLAPLLAALQKPGEIEGGDLIVVINALKDLGVRESAGALLTLLREISDWDVLVALCEALSQLGDKSAGPDLIRLLDDYRLSVRRAAARALGKLRIHEALDALSRLSKEDDSESVRLAARTAEILIRQAG